MVERAAQLGYRIATGADKSLEDQAVQRVRRSCHAGRSAVRCGGAGNVCRGCCHGGSYGLLWSAPKARVTTVPRGHQATTTRVAIASSRRPVAVAPPMLGQAVDRPRPVSSMPFRSRGRLWLNRGNRRQVRCIHATNERSSRLETRSDAAPSLRCGDIAAPLRQPVPPHRVPPD
jgi:hypothetical protein